MSRLLDGMLLAGTGTADVLEVKPAFPLDALVQAAAALAPRDETSRATGYPDGHAHLWARRPGALGMVRSTAIGPAGVFFFVQHEEHGAFGIYLPHELHPTVSPPGLPLLERGEEGRGPFINLSFPGHHHGWGLPREDGRLPCMLCAEVAFPEGLPAGGQIMMGPGAEGHELCARCLAIVRAVVARTDPAPKVVTASSMQHRLLPEAVDAARVCLAMEYLGTRGVIDSPERLARLPAPGERTAFRMGRLWYLTAQHRPGWDGGRCVSTWTWGATWLKLRCDTCAVQLHKARGCNVAGFQNTTLHAWEAWAKHHLLGLVPKQPRSR